VKKLGAALCLVVASAAGGLLAHVFIKSKPLPLKHEMNELGVHGACVRVSDEAAKKIIINEMMHPTQACVIKNLNGRSVKAVNFMGSVGGWSAHNVDFYINDDEKHVWSFEVDHITGAIMSIGVQVELTEAEVIAIVEQFFRERSDPRLIEQGMPAEGSVIKIEAGWMGFQRTWGVAVSVQPKTTGDIDQWLISVDSCTGKITKAGKLRF